MVNGYPMENQLAIYGLATISATPSKSLRRDGHHAALADALGRIKAAIKRGIAVEAAQKMLAG